MTSSSATPIPPFDRHVLDIDAAAAVERITATTTRALTRVLRRRGLVVGVSGGVDSAVCLALAVEAVGASRVVALLMPEADSDPESQARAQRLCDDLGVEAVVEDIAPALTALGCYARRDAAVRRLVPDFGPGWRLKITLAQGLLDTDRVSWFDLTVADPDGRLATARMPNDVKPISHLYKTQVYELAAHLGLSHEIRSQPPSTDTYSLPQTQEEFYFALPYAEMDLLLWAWHHDVSPADAGAVVDLRPDQVERVYRDIVGKRRAAERGLRDAVTVEHVDLSPAPSPSPSTDPPAAPGSTNGAVG